MEPSLGVGGSAKVGAGRGGGIDALFGCADAGSWRAANAPLSLAFETLVELATYAEPDKRRPIDVTAPCLASDVFALRIDVRLGGRSPAKGWVDCSVVAGSDIVELIGSD